MLSLTYRSVKEVVLIPRTEKVNQQIRDERKEQILAAAAKVFARNGFVGTRVDDIASAAGVSKGLIYHYFGGKEEIFNTLVDRAVRGTIHLYQHAFGLPGSAAERLRWLIEQVVVGLSEQPYVFMVVLQAFVSDAVPQEARHVISTLAAEIRSIVTQFIADGQKDGEIVQGDPEHLAFLLGSCIQGLAVAKTMAMPMPSVSTADSLIRLFTQTR
ncbi:TetR/AcrR family transcriptional regulator [Alicyclobacillus macrosporangiidus]|uniref:TetR/AcrR family transcriptional regulator n=1 Tax=Alicyclobacillus macrosporangiidus TaxID=392015 RepID=UPI0018CC16FB|nr:TetR/AcrR family transcriptional regulator [Alicyclobacillus macrosporangiidus]